MLCQKSKQFLGHRPQKNVGAVVVAELVEQSLPTPEISSSNPNIGKTLSYLSIVLLNNKDNIKEKEARNCPSQKDRS